MRERLGVAYDAMLRRSELCATRVDDLSANLRGGSAVLLVRRAKTDPEGCSATVYIAPDTAADLFEWLRRAGITVGRLSGTPAIILPPSRFHRRRRDPEVAPSCREPPPF